MKWKRAAGSIGSSLRPIAAGAKLSFSPQITSVGTAAVSAGSASRISNWVRSTGSVWRYRVPREAAAKLSIAPGRDAAA
jgi:hypothetical protein